MAIAMRTEGGAYTAILSIHIVDADKVGSGLATRPIEVALLVGRRHKRVKEGGAHERVRGTLQPKLAVIRIDT